MVVVGPHGQTEVGYARSLAEMMLDRPNADPDDDLAVLSRQLLRAHQRIAHLTAEGDCGTKYVATDLVQTGEQLRAIFGEDELPGCSAVENLPGEWRIQEDGTWRLWREDEN